MHSNIGYLFTLLLNLSILLPLQSNNLVDQYTIMLTNAYWVLLGIWWCSSPSPFLSSLLFLRLPFSFLLRCANVYRIVIYQQPRPGPSLPKGTNYLTIGWRQIYEALKQYRQLPYTFIYLFAFFLLADVGCLPFYHLVSFD